MSVITIRGQLGSGAPEVGRKIADKLHADYVDRDIIAEVATRLQREEQEVIEKEMPPTSLLGRIAEALQHNYAFGDSLMGAYAPILDIPLGDTRYLQALKSVVREVARRSQSLVIQGRGSQFILKDDPGTFHVLIVAPTEVRVKRVMQDRRLVQETAEREIARFDNSRREFVKRYFQADLEDPVYYDLVINTERLSFQAAASIVVETISIKNLT
jgi:cytidylate kinase